MSCPRCDGTGRVPCVITHTIDDGFGRVQVVGEEPGEKDCPACTSVLGDEPDFVAA